MEYKVIRSSEIPNNNVEISEDELQHFKYIKREMKNGKWVYYYDKGDLDKYAKGSSSRDVKATTNSAGGKTVTTTKTTYKQSNRLFNRTTNGSEASVTVGKNTAVSKNVTKEQGKLSRAQAKGEKWLYDNVLSSSAQKRNKKAAKNAVDKGKQTYNKLKKQLSKKIKGLK